MVAAQHHHALAGVEQGAGFVLQPFHASCRLRPLTWAGTLLVLSCAGFGLACFQPANVVGGQGAQLLAGGGNGFIFLLHGQAQLPGIGQVGVVEVDLQRGFVDGGGALGRAGAVAHGHFPRHGHHHYLGFLGGEGQAKQAAGGIAGGIGVEGCNFFGARASALDIGAAK